MKYYKSIKELPGHHIGDILVKANDFYMWNNEPFYTFPKEIVEQFEDYFEPANSEYNDGDEIWYISMNGIIVSDYFNYSKHSSLIEFGNIFKSEKDASVVNTSIKKMLSSTSAP